MHQIKSIMAVACAACTLYYFNNLSIQKEIQLKTNASPTSIIMQAPGFKSGPSDDFAKPPERESKPLTIANNVASANSDGESKASPPFRQRAEQLFASGRYREALDLSLYILQTRLEDDYWIEATPYLLKSAEKLGELDALVPFMLEQTLRVSAEYPDENSKFQSSLLVSFVDFLIESDRPELAHKLIGTLNAGNIEENLREIVGSYRDRLVRFSQ